MIGFETIGNATLTVFDDKPVLTTDPWLFGNPYFGSWGHKYTIPKEQLENIKKTLKNIKSETSSTKKVSTILSQYL